MIDIFVTHYVAPELPGYNDLLVDTCGSIARELREGESRLWVIYSTPSAEHAREIEERLSSARLIRSDSHVQPVLMNMAHEKAKKLGSEFFVCLHNDVRPARGWLRVLAEDLRQAEARYGRANVVMSPRYIPYHFLEPSRLRYPEFWDRIRPPREPKVLDVASMREWCARHGFQFDIDEVVCPTSGASTDDGHMLMMYAGAPEVFDGIGGCDENFVGLNYGDCDWGIRMLMAGKRNMLSQRCLMGHISGMTFYHPEVIRELRSNDHLFIAKWGLDRWRELQDGSIWIRLHREQQARAGR
jgi:GT2 family glycosyltransferase